MSLPMDVNEMLADQYEPKRQNRWTFAFADQTLPAFAAKSASRPAITFDEIVIDYINDKRYLPGKSTWDTMNIVLNDPIAPSSAQKVMEWVRLQYENISGRAGYAAFFKKNLNLRLLDGVGVPVEDWEIRGAWIQNASFGDLDYSSAEPVTATLVLRYDRAILQY